MSDRQSTLWCSWIIQGKRDNLYFSGDGGYDNHFKEIGDKYGPFDLAMMECGQYNEWWADIHMMPEETVQASIDLKAQLLLPIHWGAFTLALHDWTDPIKRVTKSAAQKNQAITTPKIGEPVIIGSDVFPRSLWWKMFE